MFFILTNYDGIDCLMNSRPQPDFRNFSRCRAVLLFSLTASENINQKGSLDCVDLVSPALCSASLFPGFLDIPMYKLPSFRDCSA
jgi:hypothetical protein